MPFKRGQLYIHYQRMHRLIPHLYRERFDVVFTSHFCPSFPHHNSDFYSPSIVAVPILNVAGSQADHSNQPHT